MNVHEFKELFLPFSKKLFAIAYSMVGNRQDAQDIVQQGYAKLWQGREKFSGVNSPEGYAVSVVKNLCWDALRKVRHNTVELDGSTAQLEADNNDPYSDAKSDLHRVQSIIKTLPEAQQRVLLLHTVEELDYSEIEAVTGYSVVNIRAMVSRARRRIKELFLMQEQ